MHEDLIVQITYFVVIGIVAQLLAWRLKLPSILLLLMGGLLGGPITGILQPEAVFGDLFFPFVSISVAVILFEGGLSLSLGELNETGGVVRNLTTIGIAVTWVLTSIAAWSILELDFALASLLGAILVVTGPTVIVPLLRHVRPSGRIASVIKWEGIVNDPIGAILGVLVFEGILASNVGEATSMVVITVVKAFALGGAIGALGAMIIARVLGRYRVPDFLHNPITLGAVLVVFSLSNHVQVESGLVAVTAMGVVLANQRTLEIRHILEFKENLRVLLISLLFVILAARLPITAMQHLGWPSLGFVAALILIVRPAAVWLSTVGSPLKRNERIFLAFLAPRGIVAAAVSAVFALRLEQSGDASAQYLVSVTFLVIVVAAVVYGLGALPLARRLGLASPNPQGLVILGADGWVRELTRLLRDEGIEATLIDVDRSKVSAARLDGLPTQYMNILSEHSLDRLDLDGMGKLLALTSNDEVNALAALRFADVFGRESVFQLSPESSEGMRSAELPLHLRGRLLFSEHASHAYLSRWFASTAMLKKTSFTEIYDLAAFRESYGHSAIPLLLLRDSGEVEVVTPGNSIDPEPGDHLISIVESPPEPSRA